MDIKTYDPTPEWSIKFTGLTPSRKNAYLREHFQYIVKQLRKELNKPTLRLRNLSHENQSGAYFNFTDCTRLSSIYFLHHFLSPSLPLTSARIYKGFKLLDTYQYGAVDGTTNKNKNPSSSKRERFLNSLKYVGMPLRWMVDLFYAPFWKQ